MKFKISLQWVDARVTYYNIKPKESMNSLSLDEQLSLWTPTIIFWNTKEQLRTANDKITFASIKREAPGSMVDKAVNEDIEVFSGAENRITISRVYSIQFYCEYDMRWYPFDQQTCRIEMILDGVLDNYATLELGEIVFSGPMELTQYYVQEYLMKKTMIQGKSAIIVSITLGRRLLGTFLTVFFPTILLNVIGHCTNFFKQFFFEVSKALGEIVFTTFSGCHHCEPHFYVGPHHHLH